MDIEIGALSLTRPPIFQYPDEYKKAPDQRGNRRRRDAQRCTLIRSATHPHPLPLRALVSDSHNTRTRARVMTLRNYTRTGTGDKLSATPTRPIKQGTSKGNATRSEGEARGNASDIPPDRTARQGAKVRYFQTPNTRARMIPRNYPSDSPLRMSRQADS